MSAGYTNPDDEGTERLSLRDAAKVLGISESGVRARFKKGAIGGERDNSGKIWVLVTEAMKDAVQLALMREGEGDRQSYDKVVQMLEQRITELTAERDDWRGQAKELARLRLEMASREAEIEAAQRTVADLRAQIERTESERRQLFSAVVERVSGRTEEATASSKGFTIFGFEVRRKGRTG